MMRYSLALTLLAYVAPALAGTADVLAAKATRSNGQAWRVSATIKHDDAGWDHYANGFEVLAPDGSVLATRVLHHPHVNEQPFTCLLYTSPSPRDATLSRMPSSA